MNYRKKTYRFSKKIMDLIGALFFLIVTSPISIITAIILRVTTKESVVFKQQRIGYNLKPFIMYKFRSIKVVDNKNIITNFGSFIRKFGIDELPQFINVLKGEMSIVGPRPEIFQLVEKYKNSVPNYMDKYVVKPGITGLAQIRGLRGNTSITKRIKSDIEYIDSWNMGLDFKIIISTIFGKFYNQQE